MRGASVPGMEHFFSLRFHSASSRTRHSSSNSVIPRGFSYCGFVPFRASCTNISMTVSLKRTGFTPRSHMGNTCAAMGTEEPGFCLSPAALRVLTQFYTSRLGSRPILTSKQELSLSHTSRSDLGGGLDCCQRVWPQVTLSISQTCISQNVYKTQELSNPRKSD